MNMQLVSIIIPLFNREHLIKETLASILVQTYKNWECIIIDDGSTDQSFEVTTRLSENEPRIKVFKREREPKGAPSCREIGCKMASGEFLIFLDSDDLLAPWAINERLIHFKDNPDLDVLISNGIQFNSNQKQLLDYTTLFKSKNILELFLQFQVVFQTSSPTWRRSFIKTNNIRWNSDTAPWDDVDYSIQCFTCNPNYEWKNELPDYFLRRDDDPDALTSLTNIVPKVVSNFHTYENWLCNTKNQPILAKFFPDYMLRKLEYLLPKEDLILMLKNHSDVIKKHLGKKTILYLQLYNKTRNIPILKGVIYRIRPFMTNIKRENLFKNEYKINNNIKHELLNKLKDSNSDILKYIVNV